MDVKLNTSELITREKTNKIQLSVGEEQTCTVDKGLEENSNIYIKSEFEEESRLTEFEPDVNLYDRKFLRISDCSASCNVKNELDDKEYFSVVDINNILKKNIVKSKNSDNNKQMNFDEYSKCDTSIEVKIENSREYEMKSASEQSAVLRKDEYLSDNNTYISAVPEQIFIKSEPVCEQDESDTNGCETNQKSVLDTEDTNYIPGQKILSKDHKPFNCNHCNKTFSCKYRLKRHARIHTGESPHKCNQCDKSFTERNLLIRHKRGHSGEKPYKCDHCEKSFMESSPLIKHKRSHSGEKPYNCDQCNKSFSQRSNFVSHIRTHTGEKPYKCDMCDKSFKESTALHVHRRVHTGERPYRCNYCNKSFTRSYSLNKHERVHTGEKPYTCEWCNRSFTDSSNLVKHNRVHTGERPYKCDQCDRSFINNSNLVTHRRIHTH